MLKNIVLSKEPCEEQGSLDNSSDELTDRQAVCSSQGFFVCPHSKQPCQHYKPRKRSKEPRPPKTTNPDIAVFIDFYHTTYQSKFGSAPIFAGGKDAMTIKRLLSRWPILSLKHFLPEYFQDEKPFYQNNGYDLARFERFMAGQTVKKAKDDGKWRVPFNALMNSLDQHNDGNPLVIDNNDARRLVFKFGRPRIMELYRQGRDALEQAFRQEF